MLAQQFYQNEKKKRKKTHVDKTSKFCTSIISDTHKNQRLPLLHQLKILLLYIHDKKTFLIHRLQ